MSSKHMTSSTYFFTLADIYFQKNSRCEVHRHMTDGTATIVRPEPPWGPPGPARHVHAIMSGSFAEPLCRADTMTMTTPPARRTKPLPPLRVGVGGPVGSGKTTLVEMLCKTMRERWDLVVVTNDIYTKEDQRLLTVAGALEPERIMGVETGGCPHTAIREDASINLEAVDRMLDKYPDADIVFIESGGDNLAATFSPELSDLTIYVIDVAAGEKIPRKGGPGITKSDLFVINKTDLAPHVGADLAVMEADTRRMRPNRPFVMTNLKTREGLDQVVQFIERKGLLVQA